MDVLLNGSDIDVETVGQRLVAAEFERQNLIAVKREFEQGGEQLIALQIGREAERQKIFFCFQFIFFHSKRIA